MSGGTRAAQDIRGGVIGILSWNPAVNYINQDGTYNLISPNGSILVNPIAVQRETERNLIQDRFNANLNLSYNLTDDLNFKVLAGASQVHSNNEFYQGIPDGSILDKPRASFNSNRSQNYQLSNILTLNKDLGKTNIKLTGIYELQQSVTKIESIGANDFIFSGIPDAFYLLELANTFNAAANQNKWSIQSYAARAEANFNNNLLLTGTFRIDQSSRFRKENRTGYFPSLAAAYNLGGFLPDDSFLENIKIRAGYGETGNQSVSPFSTFQSLVTGRNYSFDGSTEAIGIGSGGLVDEDLSWETTKQINVGLDFAMLAGRLNLTLEWYKKNTEDLLLDKPVPGYNGGGFIQTNIGEVENTGFDVALSAILADSEGFKWDASLTMSHNRNEVISLGADDIDQLIIASPVPISGSVRNYFVLRVGEPIGSFFGVDYIGKDDNGVAQYTEDPEIIGNGLPSFTWGLNQTLFFKNLDLNMLVTGMHGFNILNITRGRLNDFGSGTSVELLGSESPTSGTNIHNSSRYIEDGSFIRLGNVTLGYTFPKINGLNSLKLYVGAQNLITITDYSGFDPEVSSVGTSSSDSTPAIDYGAIPNPKTVTFGVNIGF